MHRRSKSGSNTIDYRADIYSLGAILFELLTGSVPYTGANAFAIMGKKLHDPVPSARDIRPELSPAIDAVVMRALATSPADRYQSASQLAAHFRAAIAAQPGTSGYSGVDINSDLTIADPIWINATGISRDDACPKHKCRSSTNATSTTFNTRPGSLAAAGSPLAVALTNGERAWQRQWSRRAWNGFAGQ